MTSEDFAGLDRRGPVACTRLLTVVGILLVLVTLPLSLVFVVKVVQEFERAVIFRMGRLLAGGARGPGVFFVVPCVDTFEIIDMRTQTFDVPPQEVDHTSYNPPIRKSFPDFDKGQRDDLCERHHVLQG